MLAGSAALFFKYGMVPLLRLKFFAGAVSISGVKQQRCN